ncbi:Wall-associated receptor kinase, partial [Trema orientale]
MHPHLSHTILIIMTITLTLDTATTSVLAQDNEQYLTCNNTRLNCGDKFQNVGYPFWGPDRPAYCGHPQFELNCSGEAPQIMIGSISYRVLEIIPDKLNLTVVRTDYWNTPCSDDRRNDTFDPDFFSYGSDTQNLTLYYGCPAITTGLPSQFSCPGDRTGLTNYFATEFMRRANGNLPSCGQGVAVRIFDSEAGNLETVNLPRDQLIDAINSGFWVEWNASNSLCEECTRSGGLCGSDNTTNRAFACYCKDRPYGASCGSDSAPSTTGS